MQRLGADPRVRIAGVVLSSRVFGRHDGWLRGVWRLYRTCGLSYLIYLWAGTGLADLLGRRTVRAQAAALGCPVHVTRDVNDAAGQAFVAACAPDLLVSAFFNQRIAPAVFERPAAGAVNIHPSLLPALRGVDPVFYARLRRIAPLGVSLHRLAEELDTGDVLARAEVAVPADASVLAATATLFEHGAGLLLNDLARVLGGAAGEPQPGEGSYDSWPTPDQVAALEQAGASLWRPGDLTGSGV